MTHESRFAVLPAEMPLPEAREQAVELLQASFVADRLSIAEFENRVMLAHQVQSVPELDALLADLAPSSALPPSPAVYTGPVADRGRISAILSSNERRGPMSFPRHLDIVAILGNVELDLRDSPIPDGVMEIDISAVFGNVEVTFPLGVRVESSGSAFLGSFDHQSNDAGAHSGTPGRVIRVTGHSVFGSVRVSSAYGLGALREPPGAGAGRTLR